MVRPAWPTSGTAAADWPSDTADVITDLQAYANVSALRPINRMLVTLGDSIADNISDNGPNSRSWAARGCMAMDNRLRWQAFYGTGGIDSDAVVATYLPAVLARSPRPGFCAVMIGTNDADDIATFKANYTTVFDSLLAEGIVPIAMSLLPVSETGARLRNHTYNVWLSRECGRRGLPFINAMEGLVDTATDGGWAGGYSDDNVHPNASGAGVMASRFVTVMDAYLRGEVLVDPYLANCNKDATTLALANGSDRNCLFLTDTNTDGTADNIGLTNQGSAASTMSLTNPVSSDVIGKWQKLTRGGSDGSDASYFNLSPVPLTGISAGDVVQYGYRLKASVASGSGSISPSFPHNGGSGFVGVDPQYFPLSSWTADIAACTIGGEVIARSGSNHCYAYFFFVSGTGNLSIGQLTARNLTALGVVD